MDRDRVDRYITGNYGEDQLRDDDGDDGQDPVGPLAPDICGETLWDASDAEAEPMSCPQLLPCPVHGPGPEPLPADPTGRQATGANRRAMEETGRYLGERRDV